MFIVVEIFIIIFAYIQYKKNDNDKEWFLFIGVLGSLVGLFVSFIISMFLIASCPTVEESYSFRIKSLQDNLVTKGEFHGGHFSTRGYIDGEMKYFFMRSAGYGDKMGHIPANKTYVKYDNDVYPHVEVYKNVPDMPAWIEWLVKDINEQNYVEVDRYILVVPEGSIANEYTIDLQ